MEAIKISTEYITLGQFLKFVNLASSGGEVKVFLATYTIYVNDELEARRGRKLYPGMEIVIANVGDYKIVDET